VSETSEDAPPPTATTTGDVASGRDRAARRRRRRRRSGLEWIAIIAAALLAALLIKTFLVEAYVIPTGSMEPTIEPGDRVLVDKISYDLHAVHVGDIVVFHKPPADLQPGIDVLIKRVIGLPGETLRSGPHGEILVDGRPLAQPWLTASARADPGPAICSINRTDCVGATLHLPRGEYFMMGDNRGDSEDSRYFGPVPGRLIIGHAFLRFWPLSRVAWF
jgi:signal peptidase I